ncbi:MAG: metallophosphoesterase family protein [Candidatus Natronoplasma sp.]
MSAKFLVISDFHGSMKSLNKVKAAYHKYEPDFSVMCGDITHFGTIEEAVKILERIPTDVIGVTGNCDSGGIEHAFEDVGGKYIELKKVDKNGYSFIGLSGSNYSEEKVDVFKERAKDVDIYVFHQPPYGILDEASRGKHIGHKKLLGVVKENGPRLVLSGHVHEDRGKREQDGIIFMNPGPAGDGKLGLVDISAEKIDAKLI